MMMRETKKNVSALHLAQEDSGGRATTALGMGT